MEHNNCARLLQLDITISSPVGSAEVLFMEINQEIGMCMVVAYFLCIYMQNFFLPHHTSCVS